VTKCDVVVLGDLVGNDLVFAEHLARRGLTVRVLRLERAGKTGPPELSDYFTHLSAGDVVTARTPLGVLRAVKTGRLLVCFTGTLVGGLGPLWFVRHFLRLPPIVNATTGSDITEFAAGTSLGARAYRQYLRFVDLNWCVTYPHALKNILRFRIPNVVFMRLPYYLPFDAPAHGGARSGGRLRFFHPSHLDWKQSDPGAHRNSSKGNDRFLRAFARAVKLGLDAECVILDRGPDRQVARDLVRDLGVADRFIWKSEMTRPELVAEFELADVIVDQFDVGGLGGIAVEAMSRRKPVMIYIEEACRRLVYPEPVPVLNCHSEDEILAEIQRCSDQGVRERLGQQARAWILKYHGWDTCLDEFLFRFSLLTGRAVTDYHWHEGAGGE